MLCRSALILFAVFSMFAVQLCAENDAPRLTKDLPKFDHQWKSGTQQYQLSEDWLTKDLLSEQNLNPNQLPVNRQTRFYITQDENLRPVNYLQEDDQATDRVEAEMAEFAVAANFPVKNIEMLRHEIQMHQEAIKSDDQVSESVRSGRLQVLASASEFLQKCVEFEAQRDRYLEEIRKIENNKSVSKQQLEEQIEPAQPVIDATTQSSILAAELKNRQDSLEQKKKELKQIESAIQYHSERVIQIPIDRSKAIEKQQILRESIATNFSDDLDSQISQLARELKLFSLEAELRKLDSEESRQEAGAKFDPIQRDLKLREVKRLELEVASWERAARELRDQEVAADLREANEKAANAHWSIEPLADRNAALIVEQKKIVDKVQQLKTTFESITKQYEKIVKRRTEIEKKIEAGGLSATNGMLLVDLRHNLMTTGESHIQIRELQSELRKVSLSNVSLQDERDELADPVDTVKQIINSDDLNSPLAVKALEFVTTQRDYLDQLIDDYQSYGKLISEVSQARKKLIEEINQTMAYVDKNAIWLRSSEPAKLADFATAQQGLCAFFDSLRWYEISEDVRQRMSNRLYESAIALFSLTFLIGANRRFRHRLEVLQKS